MKCTLNDIRNKEIINIRSGSKLGYADDIEFDTSDMTVRSFVVGGRYRWFGLLGKDEDIIVKCKDIEIIGTDTILISVDEAETPKRVLVERKTLCK